MPGGVSSPVRAFKSVGGNPVVFDKVKGAYAWDVDGNKYIDYVGTWGPAILGHADDEDVCLSIMLLQHNVLVYPEVIGYNKLQISSTISSSFIRPSKSTTKTYNSSNNSNSNNQLSNIPYTIHTQLVTSSNRHVNGTLTLTCMHLGLYGKN